MKILKEYLLVCACIAYAFVRGRAKPGAVTKRIAVVQMAKLGDMVCTTPLLRACKNSFPAAHVTVIGSAINKEVLAGNPDVDGYFVFGGIAKAIQFFRTGAYDLGCLATPSAPLLAVLYLGGVRTIVAPRIEGGYAPLNTAPYRLLLKLVCTAPHTMGKYVPREYLRLLEPLGVTTDDTTKHLYYSASAKERAGALLGPARATGKKIVGISPSAGNKVKEWPPERFAAVADALAAHSAAIVVFGGLRDKAEVAAMRSRLSPTTLVTDVSEKLSIDELKGAIAALDLFVSVDTGPVYIAEAFGVATVDIIGPIDEREQPPRGARHIWVLPPSPRTPQMHVLNAHPKDEKEARRQAETITVSQVLDACNKLLSDTKA